jgi:hypothetical protein
MTNHDFAGANDAGSWGVFRLFLLALGLIAAGLGLWVSDDKQPLSAIFVSDRS